MSKRIFQILIAGMFLLSLACKKNQANYNLSDGQYTGTFQRIINGTGQIAHVTLNFTKGHYSGQSDASKYPAICNGSYAGLGTDSISFANACVWTAEFDWSLILNGHYKITSSGNSLQITRSYPDLYTDMYKLTKQ